MEKNFLEDFGADARSRVENAVAAIRAGRGVLVVDDEDRENEGDLIFASETLTTEQIAMQIRDCSGIICICITPEKACELNLPMMVPENTSRYGTAFTISIDAKENVTTGVSA
ncbi:MAG: 3,4-dihydroxy-2-butanone-4-phosphate synthase, partial [Opitutales bacterium]|nr:3,4-dihydroxy-2-butanone-4-phosphate synthase [Opitutales bacterium]